MTDPTDVQLIAAAIKEWRYIPDAGDGYPAVRMGSPEDLAGVALAALAAADRLRPAAEVKP